MTQEAFTALPPDIKKQVIVALFIAITDGLGEHGGFLRAYGDAIAYADTENFELLRPVSETLILKYHLHWHVRDRRGSDVSKQGGAPGWT